MRIVYEVRDWLEVIGIVVVLVWFGLGIRFLRKNKGKFW